MENRQEFTFIGDNRERNSWKPFLRQVFICSGISFYCFIAGMFIGAPTVLIPQIRNESNSSQVISIEMASWLSTTPIFSSIPLSVIFPGIAHHLGRKIPFMIVWLTTMIATILFYYSNNITQLFISAIFQGMVPAAIVTVGFMVLTEYISPRHRGIFMTFKSATFYWGIWASNAIGTFFHWKNIAILICVCCTYNISSLYWPESPYWLATKERYEECKKSHRWLKGENQDSEEELKSLIILQKEKFKRKRERELHLKRNMIAKINDLVRSKIFYKPIIFSILTSCLYHLSGKLACTVYAIDVLKSIVEDESMVYKEMLVLDGVTVCGMYIGCILSKFLKRRTLLFIASSIGILFLYILSIYLYLIHINLAVENKYVLLLLLTAFSITICCGPMIMSMCYASELMPLKYRNIYLVVFALLNNTLMASVLKISPFIFKNFNPHGAFLFYGMSSSIFICILYKYLPETKDKTILEIEKSMMDDKNTRKEERELLNLYNKRHGL